eukprot:TRINITY_DN9157_c0_g1_i1.p1 TRINITY_DN9157_c0_g1~~TRINITY_DN9157_c0_g1_i1.p1  ORF type:complete len:165 (+),score=16.67 TRINITY_DN9157_c0_g1_i1:40-534(+)
MMEIKKLLIDEFSVSLSDLEKASAYQERYSGRLEHILINMGSLTEDDLALIYHKLLGYPLFEPDFFPNWQASNQVDFSIHEQLKRFDTILLDVSNNEWTIACKDPLDVELSQFLTFHEVSLLVFIATEVQLQSYFFEFRVKLKQVLMLEELTGDEEAACESVAS